MADGDERGPTRQITARLPVKLLSRIDRFIEAQVVPPSVTAVMQAALNAFLDKHFPEPAPEPSRSSRSSRDHDGASRP